MSSEDTNKHDINGRFSIEFCDDHFKVQQLDKKDAVILSLQSMRIICEHGDVIKKTAITMKEKGSSDTKPYDLNLGANCFLSIRFTRGLGIEIREFYAKREARKFVKKDGKKQDTSHVRLSEAKQDFDPFFKLLRDISKLYGEKMDAYDECSHRYPPTGATTRARCTACNRHPGFTLTPHSPPVSDHEEN